MFPRSTLPTLCWLALALAGIVSMSIWLGQRRARQERQEMQQRVEASLQRIRQLGDQARRGQLGSPDMSRRQVADLLVSEAAHSGEPRLPRPGHRIGPQGQAPGLVYLDTGEVDPVQGGPIRITGVYLDARKRAVVLHQTFPVDFLVPRPAPPPRPQPTEYDQAVARVQEAERLMAEEGWRQRRSYRSR